MSTKNLPLAVYLDSKTSYRTILLSEIKNEKEKVILAEIAAYRLQLAEEKVVALLNFDATNVVDATDLSAVEELRLKREAFVAEVDAANLVKLRALIRKLYRALKREMFRLSKLNMLDLIPHLKGILTASKIEDELSRIDKRIKNPRAFFLFMLQTKKAYFYTLTFVLNQLFVNSAVSPRTVLFLFNFSDLILKLHKSYRKIKLSKKKFARKRLKRRKWRKLYVLRKLKRIVLFRRMKKRFYVTRFYTDMFNKLLAFKSSKSLMKRIPVSTRLVENATVEFFYKLNKKKNYRLIDDLSPIEEPVTDLLIFLRNYHQKPYFKFRKARIAHWRLFFNKTLRKQRYKGFLKRFVKKYEKLSYTLNFLVNFFTKFKLSWSRCAKLESFLKLYVVEYTQNIVRIPFIMSKFFKWKILKKRNFFLRKKLGRWSYLNFRRATCPWLQKKKNTPKIGYHTQPKLHYFNAISYWDFMTGFLYMEERIPVHSLPPVNQFKANLLVRLHMYRYKANIQCMLHYTILFFWEKKLNLST